ncbi:MAG: hypothetical protein NDF54_10695 [archaeon GB-1867-035]|nr:hypothetical protein [Candidatus Culexmicrobium profundum]
MPSTTITIKYETKKLLDRLRGDLSWDEFLRKMALEEYKKRINEAVAKLRKSRDKRDFDLEEIKLRLSLNEDTSRH